MRVVALFTLARRPAGAGTGRSGRPGVTKLGVTP